MKKMTAVMLVLAFLAAVPLARAQAGAVPETEKEAAVRAALDYSDGAYSGDAARMEMEEDIGSHHHHPVTRCVVVTVAKDRFPNLALNDIVFNLFKQAHDFFR